MHIFFHRRSSFACRVCQILGYRPYLICNTRPFRLLLAFWPFPVHPLLDEVPTDCVIYSLAVTVLQQAAFFCGPSVSTDDAAWLEILHCCNCSRSFIVLAPVDFRRASGQPISYFLSGILFLNHAHNYEETDASSSPIDSYFAYNTPRVRLTSVDRTGRHRLNASLKCSAMQCC